MTIKKESRLPGVGARKDGKGKFGSAILAQKRRKIND